MKQLLLFCIGLSFIYEASAQNAELNYHYNKNNVVASKLIGIWKIDVHQSNMLAKAEEHEALDLRDKKQKKEKEKVQISDMSVEFKLDSTIIQTLPTKYNAFLKDKSIYLAGTLTLKDKKMPFILIENEGNMQVIWFRERAGIPSGDSESFIVTIASAKDKMNDLLFIGGDFNNQAFKAFKRIK